MKRILILFLLVYGIVSAQSENERNRVDLIGAGSTSPLTTKGDLYGFSTVGARLPVGTTNGQVLKVDAVETLGVKYEFVDASEVVFDDTNLTSGETDVQGAIEFVATISDNLSYVAATRTLSSEKSVGIVLPESDATNPGLQSSAHYSKVEDAIISDETAITNGVQITNILAAPTSDIEAAGTLPAGTFAFPTDGAGQEHKFIIKWGEVGADIATGTSFEYVSSHDAITITRVEAYLGTAPTGSVATFDINEDGTSILSTKLTIDATEKWSDDAATAAVISDTAIDAKSILTVDVDGVGSTVAGADPTITIYYTID